MVEPDQPLEEREEMEFDNEGNLITKDPAPAAAEGETQTEGEEPTADAESATAEAAPAES